MHQTPVHKTGFHDCNEISYTIYHRSVFRRREKLCTGGPKKDAKPNMYPIAVEPTLVHVADYYSKNDDVGGGRLFNAIPHLGNSTFPVLHLYGTGYDMGCTRHVAEGSSC